MKNGYFNPNVSSCYTSTQFLKIFYTDTTVYSVLL